MNEEIDGPRESIAFLKSLVGDGTGARRDAAMLLAVGLIFGSLDFLYWLMFAGLVHWPAVTRNWLALTAVAAFAVSLGRVLRTPRPKTPAARAAGTALAGVGLALIAAQLAFFVAGHVIHLPQLALWTLPIVLFTLYGAAWSVVFVVRRRAWIGAIAAGCYITAFVCGLLVSAPAEWLAFSVGTFALIAAPGAFMLREAHD